MSRFAKKAVRVRLAEFERDNDSQELFQLGATPERLASNHRRLIGGATSTSEVIPASPRHQLTTQQYARAGYYITYLAPTVWQRGSGGETRKQGVLLTTFGDATPRLVMADHMLQLHDVTPEKRLLDLDPDPARPRKTASVAAQPIADVEHGRRPGPRGHREQVRPA